MESRHRVNLATAKAVPVLLAVIVVYISYVVTGPLATGYLLNPPSHVPVRLAAGITIPILYYVLLIPVAATYLRLLTVIWRDPGYVPLGSTPKSPDSHHAPGLEQFWERNVFECDSRGLPIWCNSCNNWKPDRAHHSQDADRCTRKMDHFCPWVGGVVGERTYKFFVQFNFYSFLLSAYTLSVLAVFVAKQDEGSGLEVQWLVALGFAAFFALFTIGIFGNSLWMVFRNATSIENIDAYSRTYWFAVLLPPELQGRDLDGPPLPPAAHLPLEPRLPRSESRRLETSDLDDASHSSYFVNLQTPRPRRRTSHLALQDKVWRGTVTYPIQLRTDRPPLPAPPPRTFAILETLPGMNPWHLGSQWLNFRTVFGTSLHEWLLPIKHSPCCDHSSLVSQFPMGPDFEELLIEAGLVARPELDVQPPFEARSDDPERRTPSERRRRRRKRRLDPGWQNGERPDGWMSEKEARRQRNEARRVGLESL